MKNGFTSKHIFGIISVVGTLIFILITKYSVNNVPQDLVKEILTEFLSMYIFFACGLTMITIFGLLAKNKLLWHHTLWILIYSIVTFLAAGAGKSNKLALIIVPLIVVLSVAILGHINKQDKAKKEGIYLTILWVFIFLLIKLF